MKLISDFDGVWTNPVPEADLMGDVVAGELVKKSGLDEDVVKLTLQRIHKHLLENNTEYGWISAGRISAYVDEDPFILHTTTTGFLEGVKGDDITGRLGQVVRDAGGAFPFTSECYSIAVSEFDSIFGSGSLEPEADAFVDSLVALEIETVIVSNSPSAKIEKWLAPFLGKVNIIGEVGKFNLDGDSGGSRPVDDLQPPVFADRPGYRKVLLDIFNTAHTGKIVVAGDGISQDLALPFKLRNEGLFPELILVLVKRPYTPDWVVDRFGKWAGPFDGIAEGLDGLQRVLTELTGEMQR